jgi:hypothetical protein
MINKLEKIIMKNKFPEFYDTSDLKELWKNCHFIFDTNVFINLYKKKYPQKTYEQFINILEKQISERIWMPYQIGLEYQNNRIKHVKDKEKEFKTILANIKGLKGTIKSSCKSPINQITTDAHFIDLDNYIDLNSINDNLEEIDASIGVINESIDDDINFLENDEIRDKLDNIFEDKVGDNYHPLILKGIHKEGEYRYAAKIPPGFGDKNKKTGNPYGDLVLWFQILDYAKREKVSIIFVTDEEKKDWWLINKINNEKDYIGPQPQLIQEFSSTGQEFYMYRFGDFLNKAKEYLNADVEEEVIEGVKEIEELKDFEEELEEPDASKITRSLMDGSIMGISDLNSLTPKLPTININSSLPSYNALEEATREMNRQQKEIVRSFGSYDNLMETAREMNRQQQEMMHSFGSYDNLMETAREMNRLQQDIIRSYGSVSAWKQAKKLEAKEQNQQKKQSEDQSNEKK